MRQIIELICLLVLLSVGYSAAKGGRRMWHDAFVGFLWWAGIMSILSLLMMFPNALVWCIEIGLAAGVIYFVWRCAVWVRRLWFGAPALERATKDQVLQVCYLFDERRRGAAKEAAIFALNAYPATIALAALTEAWLRGVSSEKMTEFVAEQCDRATTMLVELTPPFEQKTHLRTNLSREVLEEMLLFYGRETTEAVVKTAQNEPGAVSPHGMLHAAAKRADGKRSSFLRDVGFDVPGGAKAERPSPTRNLLLWIIAFMHPFWAYFYSREMHRQALVWFLITGTVGYVLCMVAYFRSGQIMRALVFGVTTAMVGTYFVYVRFALTDKSSGWVFGAVFGLLYITALLNLDTAFESKKETASGPESGGT